MRSYLFSLVLLTASHFVCETSSTTTSDFASACYATPLPPLASSTASRTIPWGTPSITFPNGTTCCDNLDQVRDGIDGVDNQLLELLSQRAAYVREATRFKSTLDTVDVPVRDSQVINEAAGNASHFHLPENVAFAVFSAIINSSVPFEKCVFGSFSGEESL